MLLPRGDAYTRILLAIAVKVKSLAIPHAEDRSAIGQAGSPAGPPQGTHQGSDQH
jgi:hypothetical protein